MADKVKLNLTNPIDEAETGINAGEKAGAVVGGSLKSMTKLPEKLAAINRGLHNVGEATQEIEGRAASAASVAATPAVSMGQLASAGARKLDPAMQAMAEHNERIKKTVDWMNDKSMAIITEGKSFRTWAMDKLDWWHEFLYATTATLPKTAEIVANPKRWPFMRAELLKDFTEYKNSEEAKQFMLHHLPAIEHPMRMLYVANEMQKEAKNYGEDAGYEVARHGIKAGSLAMVNRMHDIYKSTGADDFMRFWGPKFDIAAGVLADLNDPRLLGFVRGVKYASDLRYYKIIESMPKSNMKAVEAWVESNFSGFPSLPSAIRQLWNARRNPNEVLQALHSFGARIANTADRTGMDWFRPAGRSYSPASERVAANSVSRFATAWKEKQAVVDKDKPLQDLLKQMSTEEKVQFAVNIGYPEKFHEIRRFMNMGQHPASRLVTDAMDRWNELGEVDKGKGMELWMRISRLNQERVDALLESHRVSLQNQAAKNYAAGNLEKATQRGAQASRLENVDAAGLERQQNFTVEKLPTRQEEVIIAKQLADQHKKFYEAKQELKQFHMQVKSAEQADPGKAAAMLQSGELRRLTDNVVRRERDIKWLRALPSDIREIQGIANLSYGFNDFKRNLVKFYAAKTTDIIKRTEGEAGLAEMHGGKYIPFSARQERRAAMVYLQRAFSVKMDDPMSGLKHLYQKMGRIVDSNVEVASKATGEVLGVPKALMNKLVTLTGNAPLFVKDIYTQRLKEITENPNRTFDSLRDVFRSYLSHKDQAMPPAEYASRLRGMDPHRMGDALQDMARSLNFRRANELKQDAWLRHIDDIHAARARIMTSPPGAYAGPVTRTRLLDALDKTEALAKQAANGTAEQQQAALRVLSAVRDTWAQLQLYAPPFNFLGHFMQTGIDMQLRNLWEKGLKMFQHHNTVDMMGNDLTPVIMKDVVPFHQLRKEGSKGLLDLPIFASYKGFIAEGNDALNRLARVPLGSISYWEKANELQRAMPDAAREEIHQLSTGHMLKELGRIQFFQEEAGAALKFLELTGNPFASWHIANYVYTAQQMIKNPGPALAYWHMNRAIEQGVETHDGIDMGNGVKMPLHQLPGFYTAYRLAGEVSAPPTLTDPSAIWAHKLGNLMRTGVNTAAGQGPAVKLTNALLTGRPLPFSDGEDTGGRARLRAWRGVLAPLDKEVRVVTGYHIDELPLVQKYGPEDWKKNAKWEEDSGIQWQLTKASAEGKPITRDEAIDRHHDKNRVEAWGQILRMPFKMDPQGYDIKRDNLIQISNQLDSPAAKKDLFNSFQTPVGPLLQKQVRSPYQLQPTHPEHDFLQDWKNTPDNQEKIEKYKSGTIEQRKGIMDFFLEPLKKLLSDYQFKNPLEETAYAADSIPNTKQTMQQQQAYFGNKNDKRLFLDTPVWDPDLGQHGDFRFINRDMEKMFDDGNHATELGKMKDWQARHQSAYHMLMDVAWPQVRTPDQADKLLGSDLPVEGNKPVPASYFAEKQANGQPRLYNMLHAAIVPDSTAPNRQRMSDSQGNPPMAAKEMMGWLNGKLPTIAMQKQHQADREARTTELEPYINTIHAQTEGHGLPGTDTYKQEADWRQGAGKPGGPPANLYRKLIDAGKFDEVSKFALYSQLSSPHMQDVLSNLYNVNEHGGVVLNKTMATYMASTHLADLQAVATVDPKAAEFLKAYGGMPTRESVLLNATLDLHHRQPAMFGDGKHDGSITEKDVRASGGLWNAQYVIGTTPFDKMTPAMKAQMYNLPAPKTSNLPSDSNAASVGAKESAPRTQLPVIRALGETKAGQQAFMPWPSEDSLGSLVNPSMPPPSPGTVNPHTGFYVDGSTALHDISQRTAVSNAVNKQNYEQMKKSYPNDIIPPPIQHSLLSTAAESIQRIDPAQIGQFAQNVTALSYHVGLMDPTAARVIGNGLNQVALSRDANAVANFAYEAFQTLGHATHVYSMGERMANMASPTIPIGTNADGSAMLGPNPNFHPDVARYAGYAGASGTLLTLGAGINAAAGGPRAASVGMGAGGGALSGAAAGASFGPWGAGIGAVVGGIMGSVESSGTFGHKEQRADYGAERMAIAREDEGRRDRQETFTNIRQRQAALNVGMATGRTPYAQHGPQMNSFFRYPSYASNQGLVRSVESSIYRTLQPRW